MTRDGFSEGPMTKADKTFFEEMDKQFEGKTVEQKIDYILGMICGIMKRHNQLCETLDLQQKRLVEVLTFLTNKVQELKKE